MKLKEKYVSQVLYGDIYDETEEELLYKKISEKIISFDREKNSCDKSITIQDVKTSKKYKAVLGDSDWCMQDEANSEVDWVEVKPKIKKE